MGRGSGLVTVADGQRCAWCGFVATYEHRHLRAEYQRAVRRNAAIDAAGKAFAVERDRLLKLHTGLAFRDAIAPHERALDAAVDAAWKLHPRRSAP